MNPQIGFLLNKSIESIQNSNLESAELYLKQAVRLEPKNPHALRLLGVIFAQRKQYKEALNYLNNSLKSLPKNPITLSNMGNIFLETKEYDKALDAYSKSLKIEPAYYEAWSNKGNVFFQLEQYEESIVHYEKALSLNPSYAEAWSNKGNALHELKRHEESIAHYEKALSLNPNFATAWSNKGNALYELKQYNESIANYERALSLNPHIDWLQGNLIHTKMKICSWSNFPDLLESITTKVMANERATTPFTLLALTDNSLLHKQSSEIYTQAKYLPNTSLGLLPKSSGKEKIRIAYFSADFHNHATGYLIAELLELHNKDQFEIFGFSFGPIHDDQMRERLKIAFDHFIELGDKSDIEIAQFSRSLNIDIAIDLKGFTQDARAGIFSYRAAPIQVNFLGYPGSRGADYIDYIVADKTVIPEQSQQSYSEKIIYLPNSYQPNDRQRKIAEKQFTKLELGLPEQGIIFCCFNNNYKILPATFEAWMRILKTIDGSVLWLLQDNEWTKANLMNEAEKQGVDPGRLIFAERMPLAEHLARHSHADLFLDTWPCNAHTTASDALWAELPVLTLLGESFAGRVAASLLNAIALPELVTNSPEEYEATAIELAKDPKKLNSLKEKLIKNRLDTSLFNTPLFTKNLEAAYKNIYDRYQADLQPEHIFISN